MDKVKLRVKSEEVKGKVVKKIKTFANIYAEYNLKTPLPNFGKGDNFWSAAAVSHRGIW